MSSVSIRANRGHEICSQKGCGQKFTKENGYYCAQHDREPKRGYLRFRGPEVRRITGKAIYDKTSDSDGAPLTFSKAKFLLRRIQEEIFEGTFNAREYIELDANSVRFENYAKRYLKHLQLRVDSGRYSAEYLGSLRSDYKNHLVWFNRHDIRKITVGAVTRFVDEHEATDATKNRCMKALRELLNWAYRNEDRLTPAPPIKFIEVNTTTPIVFSREQQLAIIRKAERRHQAILLMAMETGHRPSVIRALKVKDLKWSEGTYVTCRRFDKGNLRPGLKGRKSEAWYPLDRIRNIVKLALKDRTYGPEDFIFCWQREKGEWKPYTRGQLSDAFRTARNKAEFTEGTLYQFTRHSMASNLAEAGASNDEIADVLDNTEGVVQKRYKKVSAKRVSNVFSLLGSKGVAKGSKLQNG